MEGRIVDGTSDNKQGLLGANVVWVNTNIGAVTDIDGNFSIPYDGSFTHLVISYVGYVTDTITVNGNRRIEHVLQVSNDLDEVTLSARKKASARSFLKAENTILVSSEELLKAACCNLSESFETNPSIDVNFADAVTGTRQIRMLDWKARIFSLPLKISHPFVELPKPMGCVLYPVLGWKAFRLQREPEVL